MSQDQSYFAARATEEHRLAREATDTAVRRAHLDMAFEYARLAEVRLPPIGDATSDGQLRTA